MKIANIIPLATLALCAGLSAQDAARHDRSAADHQTGDLRAKAAKIFSTSCASCHLPPDTALAVDRAWITQLTDTA